MSSAVATIHTVAVWLNYFFGIPIIVFGMIGAILTIIVFMRQRAFWQNPTIIYLLAGSVTTIVHLPTVYLPVVLAQGFGIVLFAEYDIICRLFNYFLYATTVSSIYFPCLAAFDQYASTSRNAAFRNRWHSVKAVRWAIFVMVLFWSLLYLPVLIVSQLTRSNGCYITNYYIRTMTNYVTVPLFFTVVPVILIIFCLQGILRNLRRLKLHNAQQDRFERQIRRMLIAQILVLAVSGFPFALESVYLEATASIVKTNLRSAVESISLEVLRFFFHVNFVGTFYIYLYISSEVRKTLLQFFMRIVGYNIVVPVTTTGANHIIGPTHNSTNPA
ncbi:unnamed protein product [Adineta ricciae]|uniref:G-protein coupled receptors family 1 profile domain-containing protein n=1 Tax=Adineta ricciae TaxID=249248 RepID=A0A816B374_ADIRI|nr:unnamed protein product [Adineta ricciae]